MNIELLEATELPICPHCKKKLDKIEKTTKGAWERHIIYSCYYCKSLLSIGNDTGFGN